MAGKIHRMVAKADPKSRRPVGRPKGDPTIRVTLNLRVETLRKIERHWHKMQLPNRSKAFDDIIERFTS